MLGAAGDDYEFAAIRIALIKLSPDSIMGQENEHLPGTKVVSRVRLEAERSLPEGFHKLRDGRKGC